MQDALTVTRVQLLFPWRRMVLHVRSDPEVVLERIRAELGTPLFWGLGWPGSGTTGSVCGSHFELSVSAVRTRVVLEGEVVGARNAAIIRVLLRPTGFHLVFGVLWVGFGTVGALSIAVSAAVNHEPARLAVLLFPMAVYALLFGTFSPLAFRTIRWLSSVVESSEKRTDTAETHRASEPPHGTH